MERVQEIAGLDHVVLLVSPQALLGTERSGDPRVAQCCKCVKRVHEVARNRSGMREERHASPCERTA
jgi:hypothetical protein